MKFPGILEAGKANGVLTESKYIKGSYIVCATGKDRDAIPCGVRVIGTKIYVASEQKEYRWDGTKWVELVSDLPSIPQDGKIYGIQNGQWIELDINSLNDQIANLNIEAENFKTDITDLQGKVDYNTNFVNYLNEEINKKANTEDIPTKTSQLENDSGFITLKVVSDNFASKESVNTLTETVESISDKVNNINSDLNIIQESITTLDNEVVKYTLFTTPETVTVINKLGNSVDIDDPTTPSLSPTDNNVIAQINRKTIQLNNYDSISGLDTEGNRHNLLMVSNQDIVDLGDTNIHLNLNTKDNITLNNNQLILTTQDKEELERKIEALQPGSTYTKEEVDNKIADATSTLATKEELQKAEEGINDLSEELGQRYSNEAIDAKFNEYVTLETYNQDKTIINTSKQDTLISGTNIKTINGESILGEGNLVIEGGGGSYTLPIATTTELGGIKSGTYESEEGVLRSVVVDSSTGLATVKIPTLEQSADQKDIIDVLNSGVDKVIIDGGNSID